MSGTTVITQLADAIASNAVRVVDLTQTLRPSTPVIKLPPKFAPSNPFTMTEISHYDSRGPSWYWNNLSMGEHTGTHFDAPAHWVTGREYADSFTDTIPAQRFVAPACVIDCSAEAKADADYLLTVRHITAFEKRHGSISVRPRTAGLVSLTSLAIVVLLQKECRLDRQSQLFEDKLRASLYLKNQPSLGIGTITLPVR